MFTEGFTKIAFILPAIQMARGAASRAGSAAGRAVKGFASRQREAGIEAYRAAKSGKTRPNKAGDALAKVRASKIKGYGSLPATPEQVKQVGGMAGKAKKDVATRAKRMEESRKASKKSFASKHPYLTVGALYLGGKTMFGGGDQQQQAPQQPQYIPPQY